MESEAIRRILHSDPEEIMPPVDAKRPLSAQQRERLRRWVEDGAAWQRHWAFEPISRPPVPRPDASAQPLNPIDAFIHHRLETQGLDPAPAASRRELIRRLTLDLHGLPPAPTEVTAFLGDSSPDAYHRLLDRLFASPRYGERMVWNWLDAARYADSNGYQADRERTMWPWRDWAVDAFNRNMPFDQFTLHQLAGDLLEDPTRDQILATGFNRNHMINGEGGRIAEENRVDYVMDMAETMGTVWMGLTVNCCRCHDHKFDPLSQRDYYGLFAFFNQTPVTGGGGDPQTPPLLRVVSERSQTGLERLNRNRRAHEAELREREARDSELVRMLKKRDDIGTLLEKNVSERNEEELERLAEAAQDPFDDYASQLRALKEVRSDMGRLEAKIPKVMVMKDRGDPRETYLLNRGLYNQPGEKVSALTPSALPPMPEDAPRNRLGLARWLVSPNHPLTARVLVNRQWALFFGRGLVATPEDFGTQGERPSHPDLLDYLADDLIRHHWDIKRLQRRILTSATYRQSSRVTKLALESDPENRFYARGPRYRLPSWMIRDQALAAAGLLVDEMGGPPVRPYQPDGVWADFTFGKKRYAPDSGAALYRRSLYTFWRRIIGPTMFFDAAKRQTCVVQSARTNTPLHALATLNDVTYVEAARALAEAVLLAPGDATQRVNAAFLRSTSREPTAGELAVLEKRLNELLEAYAREPDQAQALLTEGSFVHRPDLDPTELAAYTALCSLLLNLDETLSKQ